MSRRSSDRPKPKAGDYAMIAIAPILVFIMISSLANFLMLVIYRGGQPARVSWVVLMYTMGVVGIARIAIEKDRMYSLGYAGVLGIASFVTLTSYVSSPIGTLFLLGLIAYLADWVIRDCTLIDENADSSDRGLLDSLKRGSGQPGRSVLYLALAAFPLYGLGQFFIRGDAGTWSRAHWLLACYLFSALALLVTTSFLGLRRYLRQRGTDMPGDVSAGWLGGGTAIIAILLGVAFLAPVPGKALASLELPSFLDSRDDTTASEQGWGEDGADKADKNAASTPRDENLAGKDKEVSGAAPQKGAPAGDVGDGERKDGPSGKQEGSKKDSPGDKQSSKEKGKKNEGETKAGQKGENEKAGEKKQNDPSKSEPGESKSEEAKSEPAKKTEQAKAEPNSKANSQSGDQHSSSPMQKAANAMPAIGAMLKWLVLTVLVGIVGVYVYINRQSLIEFWQNLFTREESPNEATLDELVQEVQSAPRRSFSTINRPTTEQADPKKIVVATFAALDAWCHEAGVSRTKEETPTEFLVRVRKSHKPLSTPASRVVAAYNRIVYGRGSAGAKDVQACDQLWDLMKR